MQPKEETREIQGLPEEINNNFLLEAKMYAKRNQLLNNEEATDVATDFYKGEKYGYQLAQNEIGELKKENERLKKEFEKYKNDLLEAGIIEDAEAYRLDNKIKAKQAIIYSREECVFQYCDSPEVCKKNNKCHHK